MRSNSNLGSRRLDSRITSDADRFEKTPLYSFAEHFLNGVIRVSHVEHLEMLPIMLRVLSLVRLVAFSERHFPMKVGKLT